MGQIKIFNIKGTLFLKQPKHYLDEDNQTFINKLLYE